MKKKIMRRIIALVLASAAITPLIPYVMSLGVMSVYSSLHEKESLPADYGLEIIIPGGLSTPEKDWYPLAMTYHAGKDFGRWAGQPDLELTVLYNFPAFHLGSSMLYDPASPYYCSFYGAYVIWGSNSDEEGLKELAALAAQYDYQQLVLADFGMLTRDMVFQREETGSGTGLDYAGSSGWMRADAILTVNGLAHNPEEFRRSYLQYGSPKYDAAGNGQFQPVQLFGRVYGKYFEEYGLSVFFYIIAADEEVLEDCDGMILSRSVVKKQ